MGTGGYTEEQTSLNEWKVTFRGTANTSSERLGHFFLLRSAELTLYSDHAYFAVVDSEIGFESTRFDSTINLSRQYGPFTFGSPASSTGRGTITMYEDPDRALNRPILTGHIIMYSDISDAIGTVYDAADIYDYLTKKYDLNMPSLLD